MATSGTVTYSVTESDIMADALESIGYKDPDETLSATDITTARRKLNMIVKQWTSQLDFAPGLKMWTRRKAYLFLQDAQVVYSLGPSGDHATETYVSTTLSTAEATSSTSLGLTSFTGMSASDNIGIVLDDGTVHWTTISGAPSGSTITLASGIPTGETASSGNYVFNYTTKAPRPDSLETVVLRDTDGNDAPVRVMNLQDYMALPSKANTTDSGDPSAVYYEPQLTNGVLYLDVAGVSDASKKLHIVWMEPIEDMTSAADELDMPQVWYLPTVLGLSKLICPMFNAVWTQEHEGNYAMALAQAREAYPETSTAYFQPGAE